MDASRVASRQPRRDTRRLRTQASVRLDRSGVVDPILYNLDQGVTLDDIVSDQVAETPLEESEPVREAA